MSAYHGLPPEGIANQVDQDAKKNFDESIGVKLGPNASIDDFKDLGIDESPNYEKYNDDYHDGYIPVPLMNNWMLHQRFNTRRCIQEGPTWQGVRSFIGNMMQREI